MKKLIFLFSIIVCISCNTFKAAQAPPHSTYSDTLSQGIANRIDAMYNNMTASPDKTITTWQPVYDANISDMDVLLVYDSSRPQNVAILLLTNSWRNRLIKYELEHEAFGSINNGQINIYQDGMDNVGKKVTLTESNYK